MPSSRLWHMLLFNFWLLAILVISHPGSQSTASNYNHEARDYVEVTGLAAGAIYNKPPRGQPLYQNITANLVVPSVSPPAGAVPNQVYGAYFWVALGTAPVLQAGVIATTVTDGSHSTTNYSAAWSWFEGQYQTGDPSSEVVDLGINPSSIVRIEVGIEFLGIMNGSQGHIKMDNIDGAGDTLERKLRTDDQSLEKTTETAWWYVIAPNANFSALANFSSVQWQMGYAYNYDHQQLVIGDAMLLNMADPKGGPNITSLYMSEPDSPVLNVTYLGPS